MTNRLVRSRVLAAFSLSTLFFAACVTTDRGNNPRPDGAVAGDAAIPVDFADGSIPVDAATNATGLVITPGSATLTVTSLQTLPSVNLVATAVYADGSTGPVSASWTVDRFDIASVGPATGVVTAAAGAYGLVKVTASALGFTAVAGVTVKLALTLDDALAPAASKAKLDAASATDSAVAGLLYPYNNTVFPLALLAPEIMWRGGADTDLYRLRLSANNFDLTVYFSANNPSRYTPPQALWNALGASAAGGNANVELRRLDIGGNAYVSATQQWKIANANLRGSIYYWAVDQGQIVTLDVSTGARSLTFDAGAANTLGSPTPPNSSSPLSPPWESNAGGKRCVACHAVSKDGSRLGGVFSRSGSTGPLGTVNLANKAISAITDYQSNVIYTALTPDGSLSVANYVDKTMGLIDAATGAKVTSALDGLASLCDPVFSPDGKRFATASNCDPGYGSPVEYRSSNLTLYDFDQPTRAFTSGRTVRTSTGTGDAIAFPSFSPDSNFIFYQRGSYSRAKYGLGPPFNHGADNLYVARAEMNAAEVALDAANGKGVLPADSLHLNYAPTVNPIAEGGYIWVVFTSPRDYGNRMLSPQMAAPQDATYSNRKQLWVTAVDINIGATDPSHPAFWLPGQDPATTNMFGYWSLSPCKPTAASGSPPASCSAGFECCSGFCRDTGSGPACVDAPTGCHHQGEKCADVGECCGGGTTADCVAGICQTITQ